MLKPYYQDDYCTIYHGDSRFIIPQLPLHTVISDPPYNIGYHYEGYNDNLNEEDYYKSLRLTLGTRCVVIHYIESLFKLSWTLEDIPEKVVSWVYNSNTARQWRGVAWFGVKPNFKEDSQPYKNPKDKRIAQIIAEGKSARLYDWWQFNQVKNVSSEKTEHPCQIPIDLMTRVVKITPADLIVDPYLGSGTTLVACKNLKRQAVGIEIEERYCEIAAKRLSQEILPL